MSVRLQDLSEKKLAEQLVEVPDRLETIQREINDLLAQLPDGSENRLLANGIIALYGATTALTMAQYTLTEYIDGKWSQHAHFGSSGSGKCQESGNA